jgi:hypothetical protein
MPLRIFRWTRRLDGLSVVDDDFCAPWIDETFQGRQPVSIIDDPNVYFGSWEYVVHKALWPALGVTLREYVDKVKAKALRAETKRHGHRYVAPKYLAYALSKPPVLDFQEGDIFFSARNPLLALQIVARRKLLEVHQIVIHEDAGQEVKSSFRLAFQLIDDEVAEWLQTGVVPAHAQIAARAEPCAARSSSTTMPIMCSTRRRFPTRNTTACFANCRRWRRIIPR